MSRNILLGVALALGAASLAAAADVDRVPDFGVAPRAHDVAVVIGIEHYRDIKAPSEFSAGDARLVKDYLVALGFPERNVQLLVDERASLSDFAKSIERWLPNRVKPDSRVFFYYSGHGSPDVTKADRPEAYLVPYDGDPNDLQNTGYKLETLYKKLGALPASEVIVVLDSCFSGAGGRSVLARGARPLVTHFETAAALPARLAVLSATQANQISASSPEKRHGVLTYRFLEALGEGTADLATIYRKIKPRVEDDAKELGFEQSPALAPAAAGNFVLADHLAVRPAKPKAAAPDADRAALAAERRRIEEEKRQLDEERRRIELSKSPEGPRLQSDDDKLLYALGTKANADAVKALKLTPRELAIVAAGQSDATSGASPRVDLAVYVPKLAEWYKNRQAGLVAARKEDETSFIRSQAAEATKTLSNGALYFELRQGGGRQPAASDTVKVNYEGKLVDGTVFDSSYKRGQPAEFPLNGVIPCWTEGMQQMRVGGKAKLLCPPSTAYGDQGAGGVIPGGATLTFEVELLDIVKK